MTLSFRTYLELEGLKKQLSEAVETGEFPDKIFAFLSTASVFVNENDRWQNTVFSFLKAVKETRPNPNLPIIKDATDEHGKPASWDYDGRSWFYWSNLFAKAYGWDLETISDLEMNEALALAQEILTDEQLDREFMYGLSEIAYPYNKSTKRSVFKPLTRPYWMKLAAPEIKKQKFPQSMLPQGLVIDTSGMPLKYNPLRETVVVQNQKNTQETNPPPSP